MSTAAIDRARIFTSGNSQAIRLPKKFRLSGQTARIKRRGNSLVITPDEDVWGRFDRGIAGLSGLMADFKRNQPHKPEHRGAFLP